MFLAPWFLAGLIAIGLPLWLHRIARTERIKVPFASVMLLQASEVRDTSRRTLKYWLLLAVRILLLILLALAFAQPLFKGVPSAIGGGQRQLHAIVLDTSVSMRYQDRWPRAQQRAQEIIGELQSGDRALLVAASGRKIEIVAGPVFASDAGVLRAALATVEPGLDRLDYGMLMTGSGAWLSAEGLPVRLHLITDLQQSAGPLRFSDLAPPFNTRVELHDVSDGVRAENAAIVAANVQGADERVFTVTVRGAANTAREVSMSIDDQAYPPQRVALGDSGAASVAFPAVKLRAGSHRLRFQLTPNDGLPQDDVYHAVIEHTEPVVLLIVRDPEADEAAYLASAIESQSALRLKVERTTPQGMAKTLASRPLADYSAVFVADSGVLAASQARSLMQYVDAGGSVLATLGPYAAQLEAEPITGVALRRTRAGEQRVAAVDDSHPVLRDAAAWSAVRFMKHIEIEPAEQDRTLISLTDQSPLLIERVREGDSAGRLLMLAAPLDRTWNDLAIHPLFVRFVADAARYLTVRDASAMSYTVGSRIVTGVVSGTGGQIFDPAGGRVLGLDSAADASHLTPALTGFYEVRSGPQKSWLAVNVDARESDLMPLSADAVRRWRELTPPAAPQTGSTAAQTQQTAPDRALGWHFLIAAAALLLLELLLANYRLTIRRDGTRAPVDSTAGAAGVSSATSAPTTA